MIQRVVFGGDIIKQETKFVRWLWVAAAAIPLSGCALPPAVSIASIAIDVASYAASGKSVTDHGISMVLKRDCALIRALKGSICRDATDDDVELAALEPLTDSRITPAYDDSLPLRADPADLDGPTGTVVAHYRKASGVSRRKPAGVPWVGAAGSAVPPAAVDPLAVARYLADGAKPRGLAKPGPQISEAASGADAGAPIPGRAISGAQGG